MTDVEYLPMRIEDSWLIALAEGWRMPFLGLLMPHGATMCLWLWRPL